MKNKSVRLAMVSVVAVLSVFALSAPADAGSRPPASKGVCCGS